MKLALIGGVVVLVAVVAALVLRARRRSSGDVVDEAAAALKLPVCTTHLGGYTVTALLSTEPYASMYTGVDDSGRSVTIKLPARSSLQDPDELKRFDREAQMLEGIKHPNVVRLLARGKVDERGIKVPYMVLEPLAGLEFSAFLAERAPLAASDVVHVLSQIAAALDVVHAQGIIHRNLGPEALRITPDGRVTLHNFGVARAATMQTITAQGQVVGSVEFMAPEQMAGKKIDGQVDLYALGVLGYQLLTGKSPFAHAGVAALMKQKNELEGPHPRKLNEHVPLELDRLVSQLMSADPKRRPGPASRVLRDLSGIRPV